MVITRPPTAAGRFYARFKPELIKSIAECFKDPQFGPGIELNLENKSITERRRVIGAISPHAGYVYSGAAAAFSYYNLFKEGIPDTVIVLGTQHTGYYRIALQTEGIWSTPLGKINIDSELANQLIENQDWIFADDAAFNGFPHGREHNIEVQIPFIQYCAQKLKKEVQILPIKIGESKIDIIEKLGKRIAEIIRKNKNKDIAIIASSDMTHFQPKNPNSPYHEIEEIQTRRDQNVINAFEKLDWKQTYHHANQTTVCGPQTITTLMVIAQDLGYLHAKGLKYYNSFEKTGKEIPCDYSVGYFSGILSLD